MGITPTRTTAAQRAAAAAGAMLLRTLFLTLRLRASNIEAFLSSLPSSPVIFTFWHNRILAITLLFLRFYPHNRRGVLVLTSASRDGMWLGELASRLGMGAVRGSSSRRGATAMRELLDRVGEGYDIAITPDGPRGPKYHLGSGLVYLAQKAAIPIVPCHAKFHNAVRLRTWDNFAIPKPFSRLDASPGPLIRVPADLDDESFEAERQKIESVLRAEAD